MRLVRFASLSLALGLPGLPALLAEETILPRIVSEGVLDETPYRYNGLLDIFAATGSASLIGEGILATAAHVIFDEGQQSWVAPAQVDWIARNHSRLVAFPPDERTFTPAGFIRWASYSDRVANDGTDDQTSSRDTFNLDFAVGYFSASVESPYLDNWAEVHIDAENEVGILRDQRETTIIGYPADRDFIDPSDVGYMHETPPGDLFSWWHGITDIPSTWRDSEDFWFALYDYEDVGVYGGNSGGPVYVRSDFGEWLFAGVAVGGVGNESTLVRAFDEEGYVLLREAEEARGDPNLHRATALAAEAQGPRIVRLSWTDTSSTETTWRIVRRDEGVREVVAQLPGNSSEFFDTTVLPGRIYKYEVQPEDADGNRAPASRTTSVTTPGQARDLAVAAGNGALALANGGDRNWFVENGTLRSGDIRDMGESRLRMRLLGPGTLRFDWSVSSEENPTWTPTNGVDVYDAIYLYLNGESVEENGRPVFLSGTRGPEAVELDVPAGSHLVEWVYRKDPYSTEGEDAGFMDNLLWTPAPSHPSPVFGSYAFEDPAYHGSAWFGAYAADRLPWAGHLELGWLFLRAAPGNGVYAYSPLPELGDFYTGPGLYPYLYRLSDGAWLYYYEGTGAFGSGAWFTDLSGGGDFRLP